MAGVPPHNRARRASVSSPINTNYGMRPVSNEELITAFGTLRHAKNVARGDEATRLYFLHNRDRIPPNDDLIKVLAAWEAAPMHNGRKYVSEVSRLSNVPLSITKEILIERGLHAPRPKVFGGPVQRKRNHEQPTN